MSDVKTYMVAVTTIYRVHATAQEGAMSTIRDVVNGGIFSDNIVVVGRSASMYRDVYSDDPDSSPTFAIDLDDEVKS